MKNYWLLLFFLCCGHVFAQQPAQKDLKVGVVLSGGGAKGLAHIGALKVIQDAGIRVDYVAGTSMGAIVGSLFAAGYTPKQLDSIFRQTNFNNLIQDDLPRGVKTFYEKEEAQRYALTLPFKNFNLSFPSGLSQGQNIYNLISQLTVNVSDVQDFSKLPIPFFCIGTDIESGKEVMLDHGSLAQAVSASGAIPSLFSPVKIGDRFIIDGGVTNNYPIEELMKKDVDFIIGVDVQDTLAGRENLQSAFEILTQINNFRTINDMEGKRKLTDLYIKPDISHFTILSFVAGRKIIKEGEKAAEEKRTELQDIARRQNQQNPALQKQQEGVKLKDSVKINEIRITGSSDYPRSYIRGKLRIGTNEMTSFKELNRGVNNLSATGNFTRVEYELLPKKNGEKDLSLKVSENQNKTFLRLALHYDELYRSAALMNFTQKSLIFTNDITSLDVIVGDNFRYNFKYYIDKGSYWSIGVNSRLNQFRNDVGFDFIKENTPIGDFNVNKVDLRYQDFTNQIFVETFFLNQFRFGAGAEHKYTQLKTETVINEDNNEELPITVLEESNLYSAFGYLEYDTFDDAYFPSHGFHFRGDFRLSLFASEESYDFNSFSIAKGDLGYAFTPLNKLSMLFQTEAGMRIGNNDMSSLNFYLGGYGNDYVNNITSFYGYDFLSLSGDSYIKTLVQADYEIFRKNHITVGYNFANVRDDLYSSGQWFSSPNYSGFGVGYGLETILGPLEVKYTFSPETAESEWFFGLGFWF